MKRLLLAITLCALMSAPTLAVPVAEFSPGTGYWSYNGCGDLTITQDVLVDRGLGVTTDALVAGNLVPVTPTSTLAGAYQFVEID